MRQTTTDLHHLHSLDVSSSASSLPVTSRHVIGLQLVRRT